jgi:Kef-type K+ transport system membrane component KefB
VVGYDDALAVIIYGFSIAVGRALLTAGGADISAGVLQGLLGPVREVVLSLVVGGAVGFAFCILARGLKRFSDNLILIIAFVLGVIGLSEYLHTSFLLTTMTFGFVVGNSQPHGLIQRIRDDLDTVMPVFFIMLFGLAGANLDLSLLRNLGLLGFLYILGRSAGKILGARICATVGGLEEKIRNNLGIALLSQAGVAVGLALVASHELKGLGLPSADRIASVVVTTVTASCVFFEIIGPILARVALTNAGETHGGEPGGE